MSFRQEKRVFELIIGAPICFVAMTLMTACSGSSTTVDSVVPPSIVAEATTTSINPRDAAADYYIEIVTPSNCARDLFNLVSANADQEFDSLQIVNNEAGRSQAFEFYRSKVLVNAEKLSDAILEFASSLGTYDWPEEVQASVDELIEEMLAEAASYSSYSNLTSWEQLIDWEWPVDSGKNPAGVIRAKLGLPSNVNNDTSYCEGLTE